VQAVTASGTKVLGALVFGCWLLRILARARPVHLRHPVVKAGLALFALLLAATVLHPNGALGTEVLSRYVSFIAILIVLVDCMRDRLSPRLVATVYVAACTVAAAIAVLGYLSGESRAAGPISDPNDFAFALLPALPLALAVPQTRRTRLLAGCAALIIVAATAATYSRGALVGAIAMLAYALYSRTIRARAAVFALVALAAVGVIVAVAFGPRIAASISAKSSVAQQNVDERLLRWRVAAQMTADNPVLGLGPAGFRENFDRYVDYNVPDPTHQLDVAHEMYLETSAEIGLPGLVAFVAMMAFGFTAARRARGPSRTGALAAGLGVATVGTAVAAIFLTEQYYLPIWLLAALGAAVDPRSGTT
jgi:O-antigen ligase